MTLVKWTPIHRPVRQNSSLSPLSTTKWMGDIDRLFNSFFGEPVGAFPAVSSDNDWLPAFDVIEKEKEYQIHVETAGMKKSDFNISVKDGVLTVTGEKQTNTTNDGNAYTHRESSFGRFSRSFRMPDDVVDEKKVSARYKNGVLTIALPRTKPVVVEGVEVEIK